MLQYVLRFVAGKDQGREFPLPPDLTIVIGRVSDVDLLLLDEKVSRKHAKISTHQGQVLIEDLASRNGTFVNGARIRSVELKEGDQIAIGAATIKLVSLGDAKPRSPHPAASSAQAASSPAPAVSPLISGSISEMPLPTFSSVMSSPSHNASIEPHVITITLRIRSNASGCGITPCDISRLKNPYDCTNANGTVSKREYWLNFA